MPKARHRLAAIMFTDIAGYTSLMGSDEKKAFEILRNSRRLHWRLIRKFNGRLLKEMGDGILASFSSSTEAVVCALSIQQAASGLEIPLRIGIHQGDVVFEKKDVLGDGVNIASRIQSLADIHGIVISENVYKDVRNKESFGFESLGRESLKGVAEKTGIYRVWSIDDTLLDIYVDTGELIRPLGKNRAIIIGTALFLFLLGAFYLIVPMWSSDSEKSVMIFPFDNYTGTDSLDYFVSGMHDGLIAELGRISALSVLSPHTARAYKEKQMSLKEIAQEQDLDFFVEAAVMLLIDSIYFQPKLIRINPDEKQVWARNYTYSRNQIFSLYNQIITEISREINVTLTPGEKSTLGATRTVDPEAYRLYLQGRELWIQEGKDNLAKSIEYYKRALEIDPDFALAYIGIAINYTSFGWYLYKPKTEIIDSAKAFAFKALEIDSTLGEAHAELAFAHLLDWNWSESEKVFERAIELSPNDSRTHYLYSLLLAFTGRHKEALAESQLAHDKDPLHVDTWTQIGRQYYFARNYNRAIEEYQKIIEVFPNSPVTWYVQTEMAKALSMKGMHEEAIEACLKIKFEPTYHWNLGYIYGMAGEKERAMKILNYYLELSEREFVPNDHIAFIYVGLGDNDKAFEHFENTNDDRSGWWLHLKVDPMLDPIRPDPRFQKLLEKVNFPD